MIEKSFCIIVTKCVLEHGKVETSLKCPYCDNEMVYEDVTFCPNCGRSLVSKNKIQRHPNDPQQEGTDLVPVIGVLTIISASFIAGIGYIGLYQYSSLLSYHGTSEILGFLILGIVRVVTAGFSLIGSKFILQRKRFKISILGSILPLVSILITYIIFQQYNYGFRDILVFSEPTTAIMTTISIILLSKSKDEFVLE